MWAMWANIFKNFVRGPSAAVTFGHRPYPGASRQKQTTMAVNTYKPYKPYRTLQNLTL